MTSTGFGPVNVALRGLCVKPLHQLANKNDYLIIAYLLLKNNINLDKKHKKTIINGMKKVVEKILNGNIDLISDKISNKEMLYYQILPIIKEEIDKQYQNNYSLIKDYQSFLNSVLNLLEILKLPNDDLSRIFIIEYLIQKGYLSCDKIKFTNEQKNDELLRFLGINVILGEACCRNVGGFYEELMQKNYDYPTAFSGKLSKYSSKLLNHFNNSNHFINLVFDDNNLLGIDLINHDLYFFVKKNQMYSPNSNCYLTYTSFPDLFLRGMTINEVENRLNFFENNIVVNLDIQKINKRQQNIIEELEKKKEILKGFYSETYPIKESIKNKMLSKKR